MRLLQPGPFVPTSVVVAALASCGSEAHAATLACLLAACIVNNVGVFWIAIELTTLISTFLVGFEREAESTETLQSALLDSVLLPD